jgi:hypothetical protein
MEAPLPAGGYPPIPVSPPARARSPLRGSAVRRILRPKLAQDVKSPVESGATIIYLHGMGTFLDLQRRVQTVMEAGHTMEDAEDFINDPAFDLSDDERAIPGPPLSGAHRHQRVPLAPQPDPELLDARVRGRVLRRDGRPRPQLPTAPERSPNTPQGSTSQLETDLPLDVCAHRARHRPE